MRNIFLKCIALLSVLFFASNAYAGSRLDALEADLATKPVAVFQFWCVYGYANGMKTYGPPSYQKHLHVYRAAAEGGPRNYYARVKGFNQKSYRYLLSHFIPGGLVWGTFQLQNWKDVWLDNNYSSKYYVYQSNILIMKWCSKGEYKFNWPVVIQVFKR